MFGIGSHHIVAVLIYNNFKHVNDETIFNFFSNNILKLFLLLLLYYQNGGTHNTYFTFYINVYYPNHIGKQWGASIGQPL